MNLTFDNIMQLVASIIGPIGAYYGAMQAVNVAVARLEEKHIALEKRFESDHDKLEDHLLSQHGNGAARRG